MSSIPTLAMYGTHMEIILPDGKSIVCEDHTDNCGNERAVTSALELWKAVFPANVQAYMMGTLRRYILTENEDGYMVNGPEKWLVYPSVGLVHDVRFPDAEPLKSDWIRKYPLYSVFKYVSTSRLQAKYGHLLDYLTATFRQNEVIRHAVPELVLIVFANDLRESRRKRVDSRLVGLNQVRELGDEVHTHDGVYYLAVLSTPEAYAAEGEIMRNCIGSSDYWSRSSHIFSIRQRGRQEPILSAEVDTRTNEVIQIRGKANILPSQDQMDIANKLFMPLGIKPAESPSYTAVEGVLRLGFTWLDSQVARRVGLRNAQADVCIEMLTAWLRDSLPREYRINVQRAYHGDSPGWSESLSTCDRTMMLEVHVDWQWPRPAAVRMSHLVRIPHQPRLFERRLR